MPKKCKSGKVYNQKLKKCVSKPKPLDFKLPSGKVVKTGSAEHKKYIKSKINAKPKPINFKLPSGRIVKTGSSEHKKYLKDFYKRN